MDADDFHPDGLPDIIDKVGVDRAYIDHLERAHASLVANNDELIAQIAVLSRQKSELRSALEWMIPQFKAYMGRQRVVNLDETFAAAEFALKRSE